MPVINTWFPFNPLFTDLHNILRFSYYLPGKFKQLVSPEYSNIQEVVNRAEIPGMTPALMESALREASAVLRRNVRAKIRKLLRDQSRNRVKVEREYMAALTDIGFTADSLFLKVTTLNHLWNRVKERIEASGATIIDVANDAILKPFRKFLVYLNALLGSLIKFLPGLDPVKEFKEVLEALLGLNE